MINKSNTFSEERQYLINCISLKTEDFLNNDFLKQFKDGSELTSFIEQLP